MSVRMTKMAAAVSVLLLTALPISAQSWAGRGRLQGVVTDEEGKPVEGAKIILRPGTDRVDAAVDGPEPLMTDARGKWSVLGLAGGAWGVLIEKPGFLLSEGQLRVNEFGPAQPINVTLKKPSQEMVAAAEAQSETGQARAALERGNAALQAGQYAEARAAYEEGMAKLEPSNHPAILRAVANTYYVEGNSDQAIKTLEQALAIAPDDVETLQLLVNLLIGAGREEDAKVYIAKLPEGVKVDANALLNIGIDAYNAGKLDQALTEFENVVAQNPDLPDAYYYRGLVYLGQGKNAEAKADFEKLLALDPSHRYADDAREFLKSL
jgi:tetratricopeptide (TPR) repeat protein